MRTNRYRLGQEQPVVDIKKEALRLATFCGIKYHKSGQNQLLVAKINACIDKAKCSVYDNKSDPKKF